MEISRLTASHRLRPFWTVVPAGMTIKWFGGSGKDLGSFFKKLNSYDTTPPFYS